MDKKTSIDNIIKLGGKKDKEVDNIYWLNGHCFIVSENGEVDEL